MCSIMGLTTKALQQKDFQEFFDRTISRGPDMSRIIETKTGYLCFHRLAIMGLEESGMQPFTMGDDAVVCNGEIYCFRALKKELSKKYTFKSPI